MSTDPKLVAFLKLNKQNDIDKNQLNDYLRDRLPREKLPSFYIVVDNYPLTASGKINNNKLLDLVHNEEKKHVSTIVDNNQTIVEKMLLDIYNEILDNKNLVLSTNIFYQGGNSITVMKVISRIKNRFYINLSIKDIFNHPTIKEQSKLIENKLSELAFNQDLEKKQAVDNIIVE